MNIALAFTAGLILSIITCSIVSITIDMSEIKKVLQESRRMKEGDSE